MPVSGSATTGQNAADYSVLIPFRDYSDKGDLRLDYTASPSARYFLRVSDHKETAINFPTIPLPLEGQVGGYQRILDQQIALGYTGSFGANRLLDLRLGISRTKAGKTPISEGTAPVLVNGAPIPGLGSLPASFQGGLPAVSITGGFPSFGRQTTNPQFQNPAMIDPSVATPGSRATNRSSSATSTNISGWACSTTTRPTAQFTFGGSYRHSPSKVADAYWADFLFGTTSAYSLARGLRGPSSPVTRQRLRAGRLEGAAQPDLEPRSALGVRLALFRAE